MASSTYKFEVYTTQEKDSVDLISFHRFGSCNRAAAILAANPGLARLGPILPIGLRIRIPVPVQADRRQSTRLWS